MPGFEGFGRMLAILGALLLGAGLLLWLGGHFLNLGRLPGDVYVKRGHFTFYFPLVTSLVISLLLTLMLNLIARR